MPQVVVPEMFYTDPDGLCEFPGSGLRSVIIEDTGINERFNPDVAVEKNEFTYRWIHV